MELDGTLAGTTDLIDRMRNLRIADIGLIGSVVEDKGIVFQRVVHPFAQLLFGNHRARRIIRITQIDDVDRSARRQRRHEAVLSRTGHIAHIGPTAIAISATATDHHVRVDVNGIDGIGHTNEVVPVEQFLEVTRIALCTVVDEDLVDIEMNATCQKIVLEDGLAQEIIALLRTVAAEPFDATHLVGRLMHCLDNGRCQRLRHVAYAEGYHVGLGMHHLKGVHLLGNVGEQVVVLEVQEMNVY